MKPLYIMCFKEATLWGQRFIIIALDQLTWEGIIIKLKINNDL